MDIKGVIKETTGKNPVYLEDYTDLWAEWYAGDVKAFHHYFVYNGQKKVPCIRKTLNMAKQVCEDWANLLLNEKVSISIGNENDTKNIRALLKKLDFYTKGNKGVEESFALGQGAFVLSVDNQSKIKLQFVNRTKIFPITVEDDKVTECAFVNINSNDVVVQFHLFIDGKYFIRNLRGKKNGNDLYMYYGDFENGNDVTFDTGSELPWFFMLKPNISNNININSPMGISIFANSLSKLEGCDLAYDGFCNEMNIGKGRIFVDKQLTRYDEDGETKIFDNNDIAFYVYGNGNTTTSDPLKFYNPTLRVNDFFEGINKNLNLLSSAVGFGENRYRFDGNGMTTATQVISENSEMFRSLKKHEIILREAITGLVKTLVYICNSGYADEGVTFSNTENVVIDFDDSIIEDKEAQKASDRQDVNMNIMSKVEYRTKWYGEDEATARAKIDAIKADTATQFTNFFSE